MKQITKIFALPLFVGVFLLANCTEQKTDQPKSKEVTTGQHNGEMMHNMSMKPDHRISLNPSPKKAQHQLMNMRNHLEAVQSIITYLSKDEFDSASVVASAKLGLTKEMQLMCSSFGNNEYEDLGIGFHNSADAMSEVFKTKDKDKSLAALSVTLNYCVTCHANFKQ